MFKSKLLPVLLLVFLFLPIFAFAVGIPGWPLVPCGLNSDRTETPDIDESQPCGRCDLFQLLKNLIDFVTGGLMPPLAVLLFVWGGFLILLGGANPGLYTQGQTIFKNTFYGIIILLAAWMITNSLIQGLGADLKVPGNRWWEFTCVESAPVSPPTVRPPVGQQPPGTSAAKAGQLITAISLNSFSSSGDCGSNFNARQNIQDVAAGRFPAVCSPSCSCQAGGTSGNITVNTDLLDGLVRLKQRGIDFTVTSLATGKHSQGSSHYTGHGVDIVVNQSLPLVWVEAKTFLNSLGGQAICEDKSGRADGDCSPIPSTVDHIHWTK